MFIIELGLLKEKELEQNLDGFEDLGNVVKKMYDEMQDMKKKMEEFENKGIVINDKSIK